MAGKKSPIEGRFATLEEALDAINKAIADRPGVPPPDFTGDRGLSMEEVPEDERRKIQEAHDEIARMSKLFGDEIDKIAKDYIPQFMGGNRHTEVSKKDVASAKEEEKEWEREGKPDFPDEEAEKKALDDKTQTPEPDVPAYEKLVTSLASEIQQMKDELKFDMKPITVVERYRRSGRMMTNRLGNIVAGVTAGRTMDNIYKRTHHTFETQESMLCLAVDVTGSTDIVRMTEALCMIAEGLGSWLPDDKLALYIFGENMCRIKSFGEPYDKIRYRIGGMHRAADYICGGGDEGGLVPIQDLMLELNIPEMYPNVVPIFMTASDFCFVKRGHPAASALRYKAMQAQGWLILNLGMAPSSHYRTVGELMSQAEASALRAKGYTGVCIASPPTQYFPKMFLEIYKAVAFEGATKENFMEKMDKHEILTSLSVLDMSERLR